MNVLYTIINSQNKRQLFRQITLPSRIPALYKIANIIKSCLAIAFSLLFTLFASYGCSKEKTILQANETAMNAKDTTKIEDATALTDVKYLALGDSYTIGQSVHESERFPAQTVRLLRDQNIDISDPQYIATTGWTTANLISAIHLENPAKDFDIVTLLIGVNDQYQHRDTTGYREGFSELLNTAVDLAAGQKRGVFVLSIPDYSATPFVAESDKARVSMQIDQFNAINKEVTLQNGVSYVDITPSTRQAASDPSLTANDGLHPSGTEYAVWASMLAPLIKRVLQ